MTEPLDLDKLIEELHRTSRAAISRWNDFSDTFDRAASALTSLREQLAERDKRIAALVMADRTWFNGNVELGQELAAARKDADEANQRIEQLKIQLEEEREAAVYESAGSWEAGY